MSNIQGFVTSNENKSNKVRCKPVDIRVGPSLPALPDGVKMQFPRRSSAKKGPESKDQPDWTEFCDTKKKILGTARFLIKSRRAVQSLFILKHAFYLLNNNLKNNNSVSKGRERTVCIKMRTKLGWFHGASLHYCRYLCRYLSHSVGRRSRWASTVGLLRSRWRRISVRGALICPHSVPGVRNAAMQKNLHIYCTMVE